MEQVSNSNYQPTNPIWRHGFNTALNINTQFKEMSQGGGSSGSGGFMGYEKNYGNFEYWSWVYDLVWDDSTTEAGSLLNMEDWPRYAYIWYYNSAYRVTFFNYLFDRADSFRKEAGSGYFWNIDRNHSCWSYIIDVENRKLLSRSTQDRSHRFDLAKHINTNCEELFNYLGSDEAETERTGYFNKCDPDPNTGWWSNWGGLARNHFSGGYDWVIEKAIEILGAACRRKYYYIWLWNGTYYCTLYDSWNPETTIFEGLAGFTFNPNTHEVISTSSRNVSNGSHGWWLITNVETCDSNMMDFVKKTYGEAKDSNGNLIYPNVMGAGWENVSECIGFY